MVDYSRVCGGDVAWPIVQWLVDYSRVGGGVDDSLKMKGWAPIVAAGLAGLTRWPELQRCIKFWVALSSHSEILGANGAAAGGGYQLSHRCC